MRIRDDDPADQGFTVVEVVVALGVSTVVLTSVAVFLVDCRRAGRRAGWQDIAVQLAVDGMEPARSVRGSALLSGRSPCGPCAAPARGDSGPVGAGDLRRDGPVAQDAEAELTVELSPQHQSVPSVRVAQVRPKPAAALAQLVAVPIRMGAVAQ